MTIRPFVTALAAAGAVGCAAPQADAPPVARAVRVAEARVPDVPRGLRYAVTTQPSESVTVAIKANGYVTSVHQVRGGDGRPRTAQPGDTVRAGTVLVRVRDAEFRERLHQAEGVLDEGTASHTKARLDLDRALALFAAESFTKPDRDAAQAAFDAATARVATARAQVESARLALADCVVTAPLDGVVLERRVEVGMLAGTGTVAFALGRIRDVKAILGVPDGVVSRLAAGQRLTMTTEAFPGTGFAGRVTGIAPIADPQSRLFAVEITLPNRDGRLKPGMVGAVELEPAVAQTAATSFVAVPLAAVVRTPADPDGYGVFVVESRDGQDVARARPVTLGAAVGNSVAISEGVRRGERVIVMGGTLVTDGEPVRVIP
jgi:multidrug efflux system membrane fusion protein